VVKITVFCSVTPCSLLLCDNIWGNLLPCSMLALSIFSRPQDMSISVVLMVLLTHLQTVQYKQISYITVLGKNMPYGLEITVPDILHSITLWCLTYCTASHYGASHTAAQHHIMVPDILQHSITLRCLTYCSTASHYGASHTAAQHHIMVPDTLHSITLRCLTHCTASHSTECFEKT
jgi:hypothetical protein